MKKILLRSALVALIVTAAVALLVWYFSMRREVPEHARVIPAKAFVVATLNLRELAIDHRGEEHLFPGMNNTSLFQQQFEFFTNAVAENGSSGIEESADVLLFAYHQNDAAFMGIAVELEDSAAFSKLLRVHVSRSHKIVPWTSDGVPVVRFDTTAAMIGWTDDVAIGLYPIGNHEAPVVSQQCINLLKQTQEHSVLTNESFRAHELKSFTAALWFQSQSFLEFSGGGALAQQLVSDITYLNYFADFEDGEMLVRAEWEMKNESRSLGMDEIALPCESKFVLGFLRQHLHTDVDSMLSIYADAPVMSDLPLNDEECIQLLPYLDGNTISITHDTMLISRKPHASNDTSLARKTIVPGSALIIAPVTTSFRMKDPAKVAALIENIMSRDSIPLTNRGWVYQSEGIEWRVIIADQFLTVTNYPDADGRSHPVPEHVKGYMAWYDLQRLFAQNDPGMLAYFIPAARGSSELFAKHLVTLSSTIPVQVGKMSRSEITLKFANTNINGLIQLEDLIRKIYFNTK